MSLTSVNNTSPVVNVTIERLLEQQVSEISRGGEESYKKPLTLSEQLSQFAARIDFLKDGSDASDEEEGEDDNMEDNDDADVKADEEEKKSKAQWPWEDVRNTLRSALSEVCVLLDVLTTVRDRKYLVLDPINQSAEPAKPIVQMLGKRKCLAKAAAEITKGAKRMKMVKAEAESDTVTTVNPVDEIEYYMELVKLRQLWRVKKAGKMITGELSYRSAGSQFWNPGLFEVCKSDESSLESVDEVVDGTRARCPLTVKVSSDLEGYARIIVNIIDESADALRLEPPVPSTDSMETIQEETNNRTIVMPEWHRKLTQAQYNLFCKELFAQISCEAFQLATVQAEQNSSDLISCQLFPKVTLTCRNVTNEDLPIDNTQCRSQLSLKLEQRLHCLLRDQHRRNVDLPVPHPATRLSWCHRQASAASSTIRLLQPAATAAADGETLIETFLDEARQLFQHKRVKSFMEKKCSTRRADSPAISCHWNQFSSTNQTSAVISIVSRNIIDKVTSSFSLVVHPRTFRLTFENGTSLTCSADLRELDLLVDDQVRAHLITTAQFLARKYHWRVTQCTPGAPEVDRAISMCAPRGDRSLSLTVSVSGTIYARVRRPPPANDPTLSLLDEKWCAADIEESDVDWNALHGNSFMQRCECVMALLNRN